MIGQVMSIITSRFHKKLQKKYEKLAPLDHGGPKMICTYFLYDIEK